MGRRAGRRFELAAAADRRTVSRVYSDAARGGGLTSARGGSSVNLHQSRTRSRGHGCLLPATAAAAAVG